MFKHCIEFGRDGRVIHLSSPGMESLAFTIGPKLLAGDIVIKREIADGLFIQIGAIFENFEDGLIAVIAHGSLNIFQSAVIHHPGDNVILILFRIECGSIYIPEEGLIGLDKFLVCFIRHGISLGGIHKIGLALRKL